MPSIDNYSLSNYRLGGSGGNRFTSRLFSGASTISVPSNSTNRQVYAIATIPAGSDVVSIGPQGDVSSTTIYYISNSSTTGVNLALIDANGVPFQISPIAYNSNAISLASVLVDTNAKAMPIYFPGTVSLAPNSAATWTPGYYNKPPQFDKNAGDMTLAVVATSAASTSNVTFSFQYVSVYSA